MNLKCVSCADVRGPNEVILIDGTCEECADMTEVGPFLHECISINCEAGEYFSEEEDGTWTCEECEDYTHVTVDGTNCTTDTCDLSTDIININGNCETCPDYFYPGPDNKFCIQDPCDEE
jgi:hypothetical protein